MIYIALHLLDVYWSKFIVAGVKEERHRLEEERLTEEKDKTGKEK